MLKNEIIRANQQFYEALNAVFRGAMAPMREVWSHSPGITNMGPFGGCLVGSDAVLGQFAMESKMNLSGKVEAVDVRIVATDDMGYAVCIERGENMSADGQTIQVEHRATNIFRREGRAWKLVHHHTDLAPALREKAAPDPQSGGASD